MVALGLFGLLFAGECGGDDPPMRDTAFDFDDDPETGFDRGEGELQVGLAQVNFGLVAVGEVDERVIRLTNRGEGDLFFEELLYEGPEDFTVGDLPQVVLAPGEFMLVDLTYAPTALEEHSGLMVIFSSDLRSEVVEVPLLGQGGAPQLELSVLEHDFGQVLVGEAAAHELTLMNPGDTPLTIEALTVETTEPAELGVDLLEGDHGPLPWVLEPGDAFGTLLTYAPLDEGVDTLTLTVTHDGFEAEPVTVQTTGEGTLQ